MAIHKPAVPAVPAVPAAPAPPVPQPSFRSGAVARLAGMPVSTLRIWEQRYRAVGPTAAPSGHRLYSALDVERVLLLRQLSEHGHAIGSIAALDTAQLRQVAGTQAVSLLAAKTRAARSPAASRSDTNPGAQAGWPAGQRAPLRLVVVGRALALRLQRPAVAQGLAQPWQRLAVFETLAEASDAADAADAANTAAGAGGSPQTEGAAVDLLLWQAPGLQTSELPALKAAQIAWRARQVAVLYRFAGSAAVREFAATGAGLAHEPADDEALGVWLASLQEALALDAKTPDTLPASPAATNLPAGDVPPRRFDDAALTAFAGMSSTLVCECPRHVSELLMQLSNFETYSADCAHRSAADAELHAYLQRVAGASRALFETALDRVARHEGLQLP